MIAVAPLRAAAAAAAWTMNVVWVAVSHVAASDWNLTMSLPAYKGTESPVCASSRKKERADGNGQPVGVNAGATWGTSAYLLGTAYRVGLPDVRVGVLECLELVTRNNAQMVQDGRART